jgi:nucleoside-diphosphate-sugar epimerase
MKKCIKTALVIGAGGFIGKMLCGALKNSGVQVTATARHPSLVDGAKEVVPVDITDFSSIRAVFQKQSYEVVYHLAAITEHHQLTHDPIACLDAYATGSVNIAKAFLASDSSRLIYPSTGKVYGAMTGLGIPEGHPLAPSNVLGQVKLISENILSFAVKNSEKTLILARIFNVYGPYQKPTFVIPTILNQLKESTTIKLGNLDDARDYIYSDDLVSALQVLGSVSFSKGVQVCNIGSGAAFSVRQILAEIERQTKIKVEVLENAAKLRRDEFSAEYADITKLRSLGWSPAVSLQEGLRRTIEHYAPQLLVNKG